MAGYSVNLFGYQADCIIKVDEKDGLHIVFPSEVQAALKNYLFRVLERYGAQFEKGDSLEKLIKKAIEVENSIGGQLSEPKVKLPYEFFPETKEKLVEAAAIQNISATQLLIRLIESKYQSVFEGNEKGD